MNNQDVSVERFFRVSSIVYRVSSIEYRVSCIVYRVSSANSIHDTRCIRVSSIECQLTFSRYCIDHFYLTSSRIMTNVAINLLSVISIFPCIIISILIHAYSEW